jgi:alpha-1,2-mannosyltransferase
MSADRSAPSKGQLSPSAHEAIRSHLLLLPVYIWLVYGWTNLLTTIRQIVPVRDFAHFYVLGVIARERNAQALYDIDLMASIVTRVVPGGPSAVFPPAYGPQVSVLFRPLAALPYPTAQYLWVWLSLVVYALCCYAVWRVCPRLRDRPWSTALLLTAAPTLHFALGWVQVSAIGLACVTAAYLALRARRMVVAGLAIGMLAYKPQLGLAAAFVFIGAREWRVVAGAATGASAQLWVGIGYWDSSTVPRYVEALLWWIRGVRTLPIETNKFHMHSWRSFFELLELPSGIALTAYAIASLVTAVVALWCWRARGPLALRYSALMLATILIDPHLYAYDLVLLTPVFLILWDWTLGEPDRRVREVIPVLATGTWRERSFRQLFQGLLYLAYFSPLLFVVAIVAHVQVSVLVLALLGATLAGLLLHDSHSPDGRVFTGPSPHRPHVQPARDSAGSIE